MAIDPNTLRRIMFNALDDGGDAGDYVFIDSDASAYYAAEVVANGGDIDSQSLHGISLNTFKQNIDDTVIGLKADGLWVDGLGIYLFDGGTDATHAINLKDATTKLTYFGSPSHDGSGMVLNGMTQYASMNNDPAAELAQFSAHLMLFGDFSGGADMGAGSRDSAFISLYMRRNATNYQGVVNEVLVQDVQSDLTLVHVLSRTANNLEDIYLDGVSVASSATVATSTLPTLQSSLIGAWANGGARLNYALGNVKAAAYGNGLTAQQAADLTTRIKTFNTVLGR